MIIMMMAHCCCIDSIASINAVSVVIIVSCWAVNSKRESLHIFNNNPSG